MIALIQIFLAAVPVLKMLAVMGALGCNEMPECSI